MTLINDSGINFVIDTNIFYSALNKNFDIINYFLKIISYKKNYVKLLKTII